MPLSLWPHLLIFPPLNLFPHTWPPYYSWTTPVKFLPQGLFTCSSFSLECFSLLFAPIHTFGKTLLDTPFHLIFVLYSTYHQPTYWNVYLFLSFIVCLPPLECKLPTDRSFFMFCLLLYCQVQEYCQARSVWAISILMNVRMNEWTGRQYIPAICLSSYKMDTV